MQSVYSQIESRYKHTVLFLLFLWVSPAVFSQSPWVNHRELYTQVSASIIPSYSAVFQGNQGKSKSLDGTLRERSIQSYLEYGWTKKIAVVAIVPFKQIIAQTNAQTTSIRQSGRIAGLGNIGLGIKYSFIKEPLLVTGSCKINLGTYSANKATGLRTGYEATSVIATLSAGKGYDKSYFFAYAGTGLYFDHLSNDFRYGAEYGYHFKNKLWLIVALNARESLKDGSRVYGVTYEDTYLYVNNQSFTSFAAKIIYELNQSLGIIGAVNVRSVRATNLPFQRPFTLGIYYKLNPKKS